MLPYATDWDCWRVDDPTRNRLTTHGYRTTVLDPDDPGCDEDSYQTRPPEPAIEMHIGEWRRDEFGNRWREDW
jgi:hypothetical protein